MSTVAFIGLGTMGMPMARNLLRAGHDVVGVNRTAARVEKFVAAGGRGAASIAEAVRRADVVATMLPDSPDVEEVLDGPGGVFANARRGALVVDFSTIRPDVARALAQRADERGLRLLDAPVSGGEAGAVEGTLAIMVGGAESAFFEARPVLQSVGATVVRVGHVGAGQTVKAANQLIVGGTIQLVAEALVLLAAHRVDQAAALRVLGGGLAGSAVIERKGQAMLARDFGPGFRLELHHKDMGIVTAAVRESGTVAPLGALVAQLIASAVARGDGGLDHGALLRGVEHLSGRNH